MDPTPAERQSFQERLARFAASGQRRVQASSEVNGTIESVRMFSDNWGVARLWSEDRTEIKLTGNVSDLKEGSDYTITGVERVHPKHGPGIEVQSAKPWVKLESRAIIKFLKDNFKGIGDASARKYVDNVISERGSEGLAALRQQLLNEPWTLDFSSIGRKGAFEGDEKDKTVRSFIQRDLATRIIGLPSNVIRALTDHLMVIVSKEEAQLKAVNKKLDPVGAAWATLARNPYEPISAVAGYGFSSADAIGKVVNIPRDAPVRLAALVAHAVGEKCKAAGHVYLTLVQARASIAELDRSIDPKVALDHALQQETVQLDDEFGEARIYSGRLLKRERDLASKIVEMLTPGEPLMRDQDGKLRERIQVAAKSMGGVFKDGLDPSQLEAVYGIVTSRVRLHTITAEPGAGKTAVMEAVTRLMKDKQFQLCAPTGKGAKVLSNRVRPLGLYASTIHSLLQGEPDGGFRYDASNPLEGDVLTVDEASMPDLALAAAVFDATAEDMHVLCLGDHMQLPSVDPGSFLMDLMAVSEVDHHSLKSVHRNSGGILEVIREVRQGFINPVDRDGVTFSGSLPPASAGFETVMREYLEAVKQYGYEGVALLMSRRKGEPDEPGWNTTYANARLREVCNPNANKIPGSSHFVGDRIMITDNMKLGGDEDEGGAESRVVNGDTGQITGFTVPDDPRLGAVGTVQILLDDGRRIDFPGGSMNALQTCYAMTVHKSQGSEYAKVIAVITPGQPTFINQNMLLTGLSRARTVLSVYANDVDLRKIAATPMPKRNSGLVDRVRRGLQEVMGEIDRGPAANDLQAEEEEVEAAAVEVRRSAFASLVRRG